MNSSSYLKQDLACAVKHAHPPAQESEERHDELDEVVGQRLEAMEPPWGPVHVVRHGVGNWLGLKLEEFDDADVKDSAVLYSWINLYI